MNDTSLTSATMTPREASIATRPCLISASRHFLMSPGAAPSDKLSGSKTCGRQREIDHERASPRLSQNAKYHDDTAVKRPINSSQPNKCVAQTRDTRVSSYEAPSLPALLTCHSSEKRTGGKLLYSCTRFVFASTWERAKHETKFALSNDHTM